MDTDYWAKTVLEATVDDGIIKKQHNKMRNQYYLKVENENTKTSYRVM